MDVLIVDDDDALRNAYAQILERAGFMVGAVDNGIAAFAELQRQKVGAILCDLRMPILEGNSFYDELVNELRAMAKRVIFLTGADDPEVRGYLAQTDQPVLRKPVEQADLVDAVQNMVDRRT